ncbi:MAG: DNA-binding protein [Erysipelotrichia bacterium]|nr:DNA-binding protein [Erysipelotrichia bacterium]
MEKIKKTVRYNALLHIYGPLLSKTQLAFTDAYFSYDLSLGEIAKAKNITRSAVEDAIKKGLKKLDSYEKDLKILARSQKILKLLQEAKEKSDEEKNKVLQEIERVINSYGI